MSSVETSYSMGTMNKDDILRLTDRGMAIFKHYLPTPFRVGRNFLNPLYEDKHASCNIYYERRSDTYKMKDFGNDDYSGDCFAFVYNPQNEMFRLLGTKRSFSQNETFFFSHPYPPTLPFSA